jgi:hypothetical protein
MVMDFTIATYRELLKSFKRQQYQFTTCIDYFRHEKASSKKLVILRHDVDKLPLNSLQTATVENELGITGTYYFRIVRQSFDRAIIEKIRNLGHEIGYHYEDLALAKGDTDRAIQSFERHLKMFSNLAEVKTICMHGSPLSKYDNRNMWVGHKYSSYGILGEPYYDIDFTQVLYLTDTGRRWDGHRVSVRDKEMRSGKPLLSGKYRLRSTEDIRNALNAGALPDKIMINVHPQRWTDNPLEWSKEWMLQGIKNQVKRLIVKESPASIDA